MDTPPSFQDIMNGTYNPDEEQEQTALPIGGAVVSGPASGQAPATAPVQQAPKTPPELILTPQQSAPKDQNDKTIIGHLFSGVTKAGKSFRGGMDKVAEGNTEFSAYSSANRAKAAQEAFDKAAEDYKWNTEHGDIQKLKEAKARQRATRLEDGTVVLPEEADAYIEKLEEQEYLKLKKAADALESASQRKAEAEEKNWQARESSESFKAQAKEGQENYDSRRGKWVQAAGNVVAKAMDPVEFLTSIVGMEAIPKTVRRFADSSYKQPQDRWTQNERDRFYWLREQNKDEAEKYAEEVNRKYDAAQVEKEKQGITDWVKNGGDYLGEGLDKKALAWYAGVMSGKQNQSDWNRKAAETLLLGEPRSRGHITLGDALNTASQAAAEDLNEKYSFDESTPVVGGKGLGDLFGLTQSIAKSAIGAKALGGAGELPVVGNPSTLLMFGDVANQTYDEVIARGGTPKQALALSTLAGAGEMLTEKYSVEAMLADPTNAVTYLKNLFASEGSEEVASDLLFAINDDLIMGDKSKLALRKQEIAANNPNMSQQEIDQLATKEWLIDMGWDFVGGALSGELHGAANFAMGGNFFNNSGSQTQGQAATPTTSQEAAGAPVAQGHTETAPVPAQASQQAPVELNSQQSAEQAQMDEHESRRAYMDAHENGFKAAREAYQGAKGQLVNQLWGGYNLQANEWYDYAETVAKEMAGVITPVYGKDGAVLRYTGMDAQYADKALAFEHMHPEAAAEIRQTLEQQYGQQLREAAQKDAGAPVTQEGTEIAEQGAEAPTEAVQPQTEADAPVKAETEAPSTQAENGAQEQAKPKQKVKVRPHQQTQTLTAQQTQSEEQTAAPPTETRNESNAQTKIAEDMLLNPEERRRPPRKPAPRQLAQDNYTEADRQAADELYNELGQQYGTIEAGETPARESAVPQRTENGDRVGKTVRTVYEAQATPENRLPDIRSAVVEGQVSHIPTSNDALAKKAEATIKRKGWEAALRDWTADVRAGKRSPDLVAMGAVLWNNAANSDMSSHDLVDLLMDYESLVSGTGKALSASRILKTLTPEAKLYMVQKSVSRMNEERAQQKAKKAEKQAQKAQKKGRKPGAKDTTSQSAEPTAPLAQGSQEAEDKERKKPGRKPKTGGEKDTGGTEQEGRKGISASDNIPVFAWADKAGEAVAEELGAKLKEQAKGKADEAKIKTMSQIAEEDVKKVLRSYGTESQNLDNRALENILTNPGFYNTLYESLRASLETRAGMSAEEIAELGHEWIDKPLADMLAEQAAGQPDIHVDEELVDAYLKVGEMRNEDGTALSAEQQDAMRDQYMELILRDIASQVPSTIGEKIRAMRYLNMLGNLKTQGRNFLSNAAMLVTTTAKDKTKALIELALSGVTGGKYERTTSLYTPPALLGEALQDFKSVEDVAMGEGKYEDGPSDKVKRKINDYKRVFKPSGEWGTDKATGPVSGSKAAKALRKAVDAAEWLPEGYRIATKWAMEKGDVIFSRANYARALAGYLYAHKVTSIEDASPELMERAREYAIKQAQEATFRDSNAVSNWVGGIGRNAPPLVKVASEGLLAFRKTPANVLVRSFQYSPLGVLATAKTSYDAVKGNATGQDVVESLSKNITGTGLFLLGALLHKMKLLRTKEEDKKKEEFQKQQGAQDWSLTFGDGQSFSIDWLAPNSAPLLMGAVFDQIQGAEDMTGNDALRLVASLTEPLLQTSMLGGLNDSLSSATGYGATLDPVSQIMLNSMLNWVGQLTTNSLARQAAQASEENRRTSWTDEDSKLPEIVQKQIGAVSAGTPGWDYKRMDYVDAWGRKQNKGSLGERLLQSFVSPGNVGKDRSTPYDKELERLYDAGYNTAIPQAPSREDSWKTDGGTITVPNEDYEEYAVSVGQKKLELVGDFLDSEEYKKLDDESRAEIIGNLYDFARWQARQEYAAKHGDSMTKSYTDKSMAKIASVEKTGVDPADYLLGRQKANTDGDSSLSNREVASWLFGSDYTEKQKAAIWDASKSGDTSWADYKKTSPEAILSSFGMGSAKAQRMGTAINGGNADWSSVKDFSQEELWTYYIMHPMQEKQIEALWNAKGNKTSWADYKGKHK
jgi:hypothetical protein